MHHHRLVLNGPPSAVARLAAELRAAGAATVARDDDPPARLVWATSRPSAVEALCARHRAVVVGVERFETLGEELERLVLHGRQRTLLERRAFATPAGDDGPAGAPLDAPDDDVAMPLALDALRRAARGIAAVPVELGPGQAATSLDDALLLGPALGRLCAAAGDPLIDDFPPAAASDCIRSLAAVGLTIGAACSGSMCDAELEFERAWRLAQATAFAGREPLWTRPGDAEWPEWLMFLLSCGAGVIESCAACMHRPPEGFASLHSEHCATVDEQLDHAAGLLVMVALQALVLFEPRGRGR